MATGRSSPAGPRRTVEVHGEEVTLVDRPFAGVHLETGAIIRETRLQYLPLAAGELATVGAVGIDGVDVSPAIGLVHEPDATLPGQPAAASAARAAHPGTVPEGLDRADSRSAVDGNAGKDPPFVVVGRCLYQRHGTVVVPSPGRDSTDSASGIAVENIEPGDPAIGDGQHAETLAAGGLANLGAGVDVLGVSGRSHIVRNDRVATGRRCRRGRDHHRVTAGRRQVEGTHPLVATQVGNRDQRIGAGSTHGIPHRVAEDPVAHHRQEVALIALQRSALGIPAGGSTTCSGSSLSRARTLTTCSCRTGSGGSDTLLRGSRSSDISQLLDHPAREIEREGVGPVTEVDDLLVGRKHQRLLTDSERHRETPRFSARKVDHHQIAPRADDPPPAGTTAQAGGEDRPQRVDMRLGYLLGNSSRPRTHAILPRVETPVASRWQPGEVDPFAVGGPPDPSRLATDRLRPPHDGGDVEVETALGSGHRWSGQKDQGERRATDHSCSGVRVNRMRSCRRPGRPCQNSISSGATR